MNRLTMASPDRDDGPEPRELLSDALDDPQRGKERLPYTVGLFESDDRSTRLYAAWTCCFLANELDDDGAIEYLVRRLSDRLDEEHVSLELTTTLDYISTRHSDQVERILGQMDEKERESGDIPLPSVGGFTRSHYYSSDTSREGVGRTQIAGEDRVESPRRAYADTEREEREQDEYEREREDSDEEPADGQSSDAGRMGPEGSESDEASDSEAAMAEERTEISSIAARSRFDKLHILASRNRGRYADVYDSLVAQRGEEWAVALRLLHQPDPGGQPDFQRRVEMALSQWSAIHEHEHIVTILDWNVEPRPWLATMFTGDSLADEGTRPLEIGLQEAIYLADAVSHAHRNGVVHGGIDPKNVVYPGDILDSGTEQQLPLLDNFGVMSAFRFHFEPSLLLDPRYAAPEYFDDQYGRIDHTTDIYHLGAVLYRMFTGEPPYSGQFTDVRESVLARQPPAPSEVDESLPAALDEVISKAMANQKLTRYETVEHLQQELASIREGSNG
jgi:hypothetical protein